jgi:MFS family permease
MLASAGFSWVGGRIGERVPLTVSVVAASLVAALGIVTAAELPGLAGPVILLVLVAGTPELVYVTLSTYLQHNTRSEFRATSMSIAEGCFSIQMLWLFPLTGWLIDRRGYAAGYGLCAALIVAGAVMFIGSQRLPGLDLAEEREVAAA